MENRRQGSALDGLADITSAYRDRLAARQSKVAVHEQQHARLAVARLAIAAAAVALLAWLGRPGLPWLVVPGLAFVAVAWWHARVENARDRAARAVTFYRNGVARLEDKWMGTGEAGSRFLSDTHPFAADLDLFGRGSLFQLLSSPRTGGGEDRLAAWLLNAARPPEIRERQQAVAELSPRLDLREDLFVLGPELRHSVDTVALAQWATAPRRLTLRWPPYLLAVISTISTVLVVIWLGRLLYPNPDIPIEVRYSPPPGLGVVLVVQTLVAALFRRGVAAVSDGVEKRARELETLATMLARLEREPVTSPQLRVVANAWSSASRPPSAEIARLTRIVDFLTARDNEISRPIAALLLIRTQCAFAVDRWRARCGPLVPAWIDAISQYEAFAALAGYTAEHPEQQFPDVVDGAPSFDAVELAHPLLPRGEAVANDVSLGGPAPHVLMVSGSNMSGKSTLLRTAGIAAVMAQAGLPVCAARLRMSPLRPGATLRIHDSLQEGRSRFFAEITRLSAIVAMARASRAEGQPAVLFLLDEVLSGTNSHDRRIGAEAVMRGLAELGALGLVTTHDLALTEVVARLGTTARNVHFEDRWVDGTLHFDFLLRDGVVQSSTALPLMRSVGLDV